MRVDTHIVKQSVKWVVYSLLLVNFALYMNWDWHAATHALGPAEPLIKWLQAYAASIDYAAWLVLIATVRTGDLCRCPTRRSHQLVQNDCNARDSPAVLPVRVLHTVYAYSVNTYEVYFKVEEAPGVSDLCQAADGRISFVSNQQYTYLEPGQLCGVMGTWAMIISCWTRGG